MVCGRRAGKGHVGSLLRRWWCGRSRSATPEVLRYPAVQADPDPHLRRQPQQARWNLFADIVALIVHAPVLRPYIVSLTKDRLILATPADLARADRHHDGTIEIVAKETTLTAGRGPGPSPSSDEMAFIEPPPSNSSAEELYSAATPALDQFGEGPPCGAGPPRTTRPAGSTPSTAGAADRPGDRQAAFPEILTLQAPLVGPHEDYGKPRCCQCPPRPAARIPCCKTEGRPRCFPPTGRPISPTTTRCASSRRARSCSSGRAAGPVGHRARRLPRTHEVDRLFAPYKGRAADPATADPATEVRDRRRPSSKGDAFTGREPHPSRMGHPTWWSTCPPVAPADYDHGTALDDILDRLVEDIRAFRAEAVILDQYGGDFVRQRPQPAPLLQPRTGRTSSSRRTGPARNLHGAAVLREAPSWATSCYPEPQLGRELRFLRETPAGRCPTSGPVQTDDPRHSAHGPRRALPRRGRRRPALRGPGDTRPACWTPTQTTHHPSPQPQPQRSFNMRGTRRQNHAGASCPTDDRRVVGASARLRSAQNWTLLDNHGHDRVTDTGKSVTGTSGISTPGDFLPAPRGRGLEKRWQGAAAATFRHRVWTGGGRPGPWRSLRGRSSRGCRVRDFGPAPGCSRGVVVRRRVRVGTGSAGVRRGSGEFVSEGEPEQVEPLAAVTDRVGSAEVEGVVEGPVDGLGVVALAEQPVEVRIGRGMGRTFSVRFSLRARSSPLPWRRTVTWPPSGSR